MGWLKRRSEGRDIDAFWRDGVPFDIRRETRVGFRQFKVRTQAGLADGVLFVTDRRFVFRFLAASELALKVNRNGFASGGFTMKLFEEVDNVVKGDAAGKPQGAGEFAIVFEIDGSKTALVLESGSDEPGVVAVCEQLYKDTLAAFRAAKAAA